MNDEPQNTAENGFEAQMGKGRPKGVPNRTTALLKDAILQAATQAGGDAGMVGYLTEQAKRNPTAFLPLLGKVLPMQVTGEDGGPISVTLDTSALDEETLRKIAAAKGRDG